MKKLYFHLTMLLLPLYSNAIASEGFTTYQRLQVISRARMAAEAGEAGEGQINNTVYHHVDQRQVREDLKAQNPPSQGDDVLSIASPTIDLRDRGQPVKEIYFLVENPRTLHIDLSSHLRGEAERVEIARPTILSDKNATRELEIHNLINLKNIRIE